MLPKILRKPYVKELLLYITSHSLKVAGLPLYIAEKEDDIPALRTKVDGMLDEVLSAIQTEDHGVHVQASVNTDL